MIQANDNYRGIAIEIIHEDNYSCAKYRFEFEGKEYSGPDASQNEDDAAAEAYRKIDELLNGKNE